MYFSEDINRNLAEKLFAHIRDSSTDQASELYEYDLSIYSDPDIAAREREMIFEKLPMMALHSSQLPEAGSFVTVDLNRSNVLVTRDKDGSVQAFLNVCRHRGATLELRKSGKQSRFSCPYHGWTFTNGGDLVGVSYGKSTGVALPCRNRDLVGLPVEERHGFIWIVEDPAGSIDVASHLGPDMDSVLANYDMGAKYCYREQVFEFGQNWKVMLDGLLDGYHVQFVHGATIQPYFYLNMLAMADIEGDHGVSANPRRKIDQIVEAEAPGASPLDPFIVVGNLVAPNVSIQLHPHHVEFWTMYQDPDDPSRSRAHLRFLTPQKEYEGRPKEIVDKNWGIAEAAILNEDVPIGDSVQRSARMPKTGKLVLGLNEVMNQQFHRTYDRYMAG